ncbi:MAG: hypothetical protein ACI3Z8_07585 [Paludibacteraceae bacterium]
MKRLSTLVLAALVAGATYALPLKVAETPTSLKGEKAAASLVAAPAESALMQNTNSAVAKKPSANHQLRAEAWQKAHGLDRNILTETAKRALRPAADGETADTVLIEPATMSQPEYYPETGDWFLGFADITGYYIVKLDWVNWDPTNPYGTFSIDDLDLNYSYIVDYNTYSYVNFETCDFTFEKKTVSKNLSELSLDGVITGDDGVVYVLQGKSEALTPADTVRASLAATTINMTSDTTVLIEGADANTSVKVVLNSPWLVGSFMLSDVDLEQSEIKVDNKVLELWDAAIVIKANDDATKLLAEMTLLTTDTVIYELTLDRPLVAKDTIEAKLPNMVIDDSWAGWFGIYFIDASNANLSLSLVTTGVEPDTVYSVSEGTMTVTLETATAVLDAIAGTLVLHESVDGDITGDFVCFATDENVYKLHLCWEVPTPTSTRTLTFDNRATAYGYPEDGLLQLIGLSNEARCGVAVQNWELGKKVEFEGEDVLLDYTFVELYNNGDTTAVQVAAASGVVDQVNDTLRITAELIGFDSVQYNVSLWYAVPVAKETVDLGTLTDVTFINALSQGLYQLMGATADSSIIVSVTPVSDEVAGTFENNGMFVSDFNSNYTWVKISATETYLKVLKGTAVVTLVGEDITATCSLICENDVEYKAVLKAKYEKAHIDYDMPDTPVDATFTAENYEFEVDTDNLEAYGALTFYAAGIDNADYLALEFLLDPANADATTILPAGEYEISDSYAEGTATAGDFDGVYVYPCFFAQVTPDGYLSTSGLYFLVSGKITVEKVGEADLHIVVDALNSYDVPVKIDVNTTATAINNVENDAVKAVKFVKNGQLFIQRGEKLYNVLGAMAE